MKTFDELTKQQQIGACEFYLAKLVHSLLNGWTPADEDYMHLARAAERAVTLANAIDMPEMAAWYLMESDGSELITLAQIMAQEGHYRDDNEPMVVPLSAVKALQEVHQDCPSQE